MAKVSYRGLVTGRVLSERRSGVDRRLPTSFFSLFTNRFRRRKSSGRRETDSGRYVDVYGWRTWSVLIAVLVLSAVDAIMTALHVVDGTATELNPIMAAVIKHGGLPGFFGAKAAMTIFPMAIIVVHKEWPTGKLAARICLLAYALLSLYHLYLILVLY
jgi:hypothetical protein